MGKTLPWLEADHPYAEANVTITRDRFTEIIEEAIEVAIAKYPDDVALLQPEKLRAVAKSNSQIDANTWRCQDSCGCPLTSAGRVHLFTEGDEGKNETSIPHIYNTFVFSYDAQMSKEFDHNGPITATIID